MRPPQAIQQLLLLLMLVAAGADARLRLALFYDPDDGLHQDVAFKNAVRHFNNIHEHAFEEVLVSVTGMDSFKLSQRACALAADGVAAFFGPQDAALAGTVASVARTTEIPHLVTTWAPTLPPGAISVNLYPEAEALARALAALVSELGWRSYSLLTDGPEALARLQAVLEARGPQHQPLLIRQLHPDGDDRPMLKQMKHNSEMRVVLLCEPARAYSVLQQTRELGMMDVYHSFFLAHLDTHTVDLTEFRTTGANITAVRLLDPTAEPLREAVDFWVNYERMHGRALPLSPSTVKTETALVYDAARFYYHAVTQVNGTHAGLLAARGSASCLNGTYPAGLLLANFMLGTEDIGASGPVRVDHAGRRTDFRLQITELARDGFVETGEWTPHGGYANTRSSVDLDSQISQSLQSKLIIVTSRIGEPFLRFKQPRDPNARGNDQFEGYSMDIITEIARVLNMTFEFRLVADGGYGSWDAKKQKWTGLLGELLDRKADLAICDLTITYVREQGVDFTMPFMNLGISILYKKSEKAETNLFSFLEPFSIDVWIYMCTAYLGVSLLLFVLARANPNEWDSGHPCDQEPEELENNFNMVNCLWFSLGSLMGQGCDILPRASPYEWEGGGPHDPDPSELENNFTLLNSLWFTIGSLMQQGSDVLPKAVSTRMVAGMWWFFTLIMISSYTANLAAFLTASRQADSIRSVEDLAKQNKIKYGTYQFGSTAAFFRDSNNSLYQRMWTVMMQARPNVFTSGNKEGVERVKKGKGDYAFFMESTSIEYEIRKNCDLIKVGGQLDSKGYGIALPPGSPYRKMINGAILNLQEAGLLKVLKDRWWREKVPDGCAGMPVDDAAEDSADLGLTNVGGVFLVLFFGCAAAFIVAILEFLWNCRKIAVQEKITPVQAMKRELRFAVNCSAQTKPAPKTDSSDDGGGSGGGSAAGSAAGSASGSGSGSASAQGSFQQLRNYGDFGAEHAR